MLTGLLMPTGLKARLGQSVSQRMLSGQLVLVYQIMLPLQKY